MRKSGSPPPELKTPPPEHLSAASRELWRRILDEASFVFQAHHLEQLAILCEARDRAAMCRAILLTEPAFTANRGHPALAAEREAQRTALRAISALNLDGGEAKPGHKLAGGVFR